MDRERPGPNPWVRKIIGLRYNYGKAEAAYFERNPFCEGCEEDRLAVLTIHHVKGKKVKEFQTLCHNCHQLIHCNEPEWSQAHHVELVCADLATYAATLKRYTEMASRHRQGESQRAIGRDMGLSHVMVRYAIAHIRKWCLPKKHDFFQLA